VPFYGKNILRLVMKRSIETNSSSLKADAWHHRSDAITSVAAFTGIDCFINGQRI
jgi:divalent metal cation (Fe/Co/Zn/Cd) transporter